MFTGESKVKNQNKKIKVKTSVYIRSDKYRSDGTKNSKKIIICTKSVN